MRLGRRSARLLQSNRFARGFVLISQAVGSRDENGRWVAGVETSTDLKGLVRPATNTERLQLREAERLSEAITIFLNTMDRDKIRPLRVGTAQTNSDKIFVDNLYWAVRAVDDWSDFGHIKAICTRLEAQND